MQLSLTSYAELAALVDAWATTHELTLLAIVSRPGLGKTELAARTAGKLGVDKLLRLDTHVTPLQLYIDLYRARKQPVILDDLSDQILNHPICLSILKSVCDSRRERRVQYNSTTPLLAASHTPPAFTSISPVLILCNQFSPESPAQQALLSRAIRVTFSPDVQAVLDYVDSWAEQRDVLHWYQSRLHLFPDFSARDYAISSSLARAGLDWQALALRSTGIKPGPPPAPNQAALPF